MAERRYVSCVKCGNQIDKRDDFGWVYNKSSRRYTCSACSAGYQNGRRTTSTKYKSSSKRSGTGGSIKTPSAKTYKTVGIFAKIAGILIFVLSLLLLLAVPPVGIFFAILGVVFFLWGNSYIKKANAINAPQEEIEK